MLFDADKLPCLPGNGKVRIAGDVVVEEPFRYSWECDKLPVARAIASTEE